MKPNGTETKNGVLLALAGSTDKMVQLGTLGAVLLGSMGSFFQTHQLSEQSAHDRDRAVKQIHELYERVDEFERRQVKALENQNKIIDSNSEQLRNQETILILLKKNQEQLMKAVEAKKP